MFLESEYVDKATEGLVDLLAGYRDAILNNAAGSYLDSLESFIDARGSVGIIRIYYTCFLFTLLMNSYKTFSHCNFPLFSPICLDFDEEEKSVVKSLDDEGDLVAKDFHGDIEKILHIVRGKYDGCHESPGK